MRKKSMPVKPNSFQVLPSPIEDSNAKKYVFYVKVDDVPMEIPMATRLSVNTRKKN